LFPLFRPSSLFGPQSFSPYNIPLFLQRGTLVVPPPNEGSHLMAPHPTLCLTPARDNYPRLAISSTRLFPFCYPPPPPRSSTQSFVKYRYFLLPPARRLKPIVLIPLSHSFTPIPVQFLRLRTCLPSSQNALGFLFILSRPLRQRDRFNYSAFLPASRQVGGRPALYLAFCFHPLCAGRSSNSFPPVLSLVVKRGVGLPVRSCG